MHRADPAPELAVPLTTDEINDIIKAALTALADPRILTVWNGPRSNEVGFTTTAGEHVVMQHRRRV